MYEVTNENFKEIYPQLEQVLKNASFVAIDTELTGIEADNIKNSLFDSINDRYDNQRNIIQPYIIIQFGLAAFQRTQDKNEYTVQTFNFFILPRAIPTKNRQFLWQAAALEFLATYGFDFNKFSYNGISYLNLAEQATLQQQLQKNMLFRNVERHISYKEEDLLRDYINQVAKWLSTMSDETKSFKIDIPTPILQYLTHKELRHHFPNIWTLSGNNEITVIKIQSDVRKILEEEEGCILEDAVLDSYKGFTKVFDLLVAIKKPIIMHNAMLDLMFMHQQFYKPLPKKYIHFKNKIHELFPTIYDTKFLSYELRGLLQTEERWQINSLGSLYDYFTNRGKYLTIGSPVIKLIYRDSEVVATSKNCHTAGWDAYFAGYIFIRMAHTFASKYFTDASTLRHFTNTELMNSVKNFANCINVIRCNISHLKLDGPEPVSTRPKWLYVKPLASKSITAIQIADKMSNFGTVDVKQYTSKRVLVAVTNHRSARDILEHFKQNKELHVVPYNPIRHSPSVQFALWTGMIISSGFLAWVLHQKIS